MRKEEEAEAAEGIDDGPEPAVVPQPDSVEEVSEPRIAQPDSAAQLVPALEPVTLEQLEATGPGRGGLWAAAVYALCTMALGYPALSGQFLAGPNSDQFIAGYAFREFGASVLRETGAFAQWNPYLFGGMPFIAAMHGDIFYPTFLLRMIMPTDAAMTWSFMLHLFLAGFFTYRFLRASGFSFYSALFGGVAYMMSGQLASLVSPGHDGKLSVSALFPLTLWMLTLGIRRGVRWSWGILALATGLAVLSPHPQLLQYMLLASAAFTIHLAISAVRSGALSARTAIARMGFALGAVAIGMMMGAIQYLPVREYVAWSPRAGGLPDYATATSYAWPIKELFDAYLPQFTGMVDAYWGVNGIHFHSDYQGAVALVLAGGAFAGFGKDPRKGYLLFWTVTLVIALLWAVGGDTPFYRIPYEIIPGTKYFRAPSTVFFVGTMGLAVLSASGVEKLLRRQVSYRYAFGWLGFAALVAGLASAGVLTDFAQALAPAEMVDAIIDNATEVFIGAWRSFGFVLLAIAVIILYKSGRLNLTAAGWWIVLLAAGDSWSIMRIYWVFSPPAAVLYHADAAIDSIKSDPNMSRVLALEVEPNPKRDTNLQGDGLMIHRVRTVLGYHGNQLGRYNELLQKDQGFQQIFNPRVWQLLNIRYLLTNSANAGTFFPGARRVIGPVESSAGTEVHLYRLPGENPYAWVAPVAVKAEDASVGATLFNDAFALDRAALFAPDAQVSAADSVEALPPALGLKATATSYQPGRVTIDLSAPAPGGSALIVSENYYPGWRAEADGRPLPVGRADYTLIGVQLREGVKRVNLEFSSDVYRNGKLITMLAILATATLIATGIIRERKAIG